MAPPKIDKKKLESCKKEFQLELKKFGSKIKKPQAKLAEIGELKLEINKIKKPSPDDKKKLKKLLLDEKSVLDVIKKDADTASKRLQNLVKNYSPDDKTEQKAWDKGMAGWYVDILNKPSGIGIGKGLRLNGDISFSKPQVGLTISGEH